MFLSVLAFTHSNAGSSQIRQCQGTIL